MRRNRGGAHDWRRPSHRDGDASQASNGVGADGVGDRRRVVAARRARGEPFDDERWKRGNALRLGRGVREISRHETSGETTTRVFAPGRGIQRERVARAANEHENARGIRKDVEYEDVRKKKAFRWRVPKGGGGRKGGFFFLVLDLCWSLVLTKHRTDDDDAKRIYMYIYIPGRGLVLSQRREESLGTRIENKLL